MFILKIDQDNQDFDQTVNYGDVDVRKFVTVTSLCVCNDLSYTWPGGHLESPREGYCDSKTGGRKQTKEEIDVNDAVEILDNVLNVFTRD